MSLRSRVQFSVQPLSLLNLKLYNRMEKGVKNELKFFESLILFLDAFLAFMIIFFAGLLIETNFGKAALAFGFVMLVVSFVLKVMQKW